MAAKRTILNPINNVLYVEPNYVHSTDMYGANGLETYEMIPDLEDYSIYVNLEVEVVGRTINSTNKKYILSYVSSGDKESINLMQGSKVPIGEGNSINSLTTNYTDLHINEMRSVGASTELFGISSIDISYRNYTVPEVTIEFVDVRGASVFGQRELYESESKERAIDNSGTIDIQNTFFQCFFTFPYPKFTLFVKGFYGEPVSYELTCSDFRARFNSDTGNFSCTAKFVGYMFSFLNDVMMNGLIAAPCSDFVGAEYWDSRNFTLLGNDNTKKPVPKLVDLLKKVPSSLSQAEHIKKNSPEVQEKNNIESIKGEIDNIKRLYDSYCESIILIVKNTFVDNDLKIVFTSNNDSRITDGAIILIESDENYTGETNFKECFNDDNGEISGRYESIVNTLAEFNKNHPAQKLPDFADISLANAERLIYPNENDGTKYVVDNGGNNNKIKEANEKLYNVFKDNVNNENNKSGENVSRYSKYQFGFFFNDNGFYKAITSLINSTNDREKKVNDIIESSVNDALSEILGFYPTIENMTRIVMAHFETFAYMIFKTAQLIESENPKRTLSSLGLSNPDDFSDVSGLTDKEKEVPPFPKVTEIVEKDGIKNREETWIGVYGKKFREIDLVHGILNGIKEVAKQQEAGENTGSAGSDSSLSSKVKTPLSTLDFIATKQVYSKFDQTEPSDLLSIVALRAIQLIASSNFSGWDEKCDVLGEMEANNLLFSSQISNDLLEKITSKTSDNVIEMLKGKDVEGLKPSSGIWPWSNSSSNEGMISDNGDLNVCKLTTNNNNNLFTIPYQALEWDKIKQEILTKKSSISNDYFNVGENDFINKNKPTTIFNIETNINRIKKIAEEQMVNDEVDMSFYRDKIVNESTYNSDKYEDYLNGDAKDVIANYIEGAEKLQPSPESCMLPSSVSYFKQMNLFAGGYDMDGFINENPGDGQQSLLGLIGNGWTDVNGNPVKRTSGEGYKEFLQDTDTGKHTITEFPGIDSDFEPTFDVSLFGEELYYLQTNDKVKAFMFLCSLGKIYDYEKIFEDEICDETKTISIIPLPSVLYAGGLIWARSHTDEFKYCNPFKKHIIHDNPNTTCYNKLINTFNKNSLIYLLKTFEDFVTKGVDGNSIIKPFSFIKNCLELQFIKRDVETLFNNIGEIEESSFFGGETTWYKEGEFESSNYSTLLEFLVGEFGESLFKNYITIDEDFENGGGKVSGMRLGNRDGSIGVVSAVNVGLCVCTFMKITKFIYKDSPSKVSVDEGKLKSFFNSFLERLKKERIESANTDTSVSNAEETDTSVEIKIGVYRYCKLLYDKWIGGTKEEDFKKMWSFEEFFENNDKYFHFIDSYYNKIGQYILINIGDFCDQIKSCYTSEQYSLLSFLSYICSKNKFNLLCVQNFLDMQSMENMEKMFDCIPYNSIQSIKKHTNFILNYIGEPSSHLDYDDSYNNDGFMINEPESTVNKWPEALKSRIADSENDYNVPAFGVSYGKMYQSYFKDIDVSMDNPKVTEQSIKAYFAIVSLNNTDKSTDDRSNGNFIGQDLFSVYSNNSYTCTITMMGCAWVQPMMYFVLNNVPMFRGTYMIISVSHRIEQGDMVTKFTGVRMANVSTRIARECCVRGKNDNTDSVNGSNSNGENENSKYATTDNDCPYKVFPIVDVSGGNYGEPNYSSLLSGTVGEAKGNKLGEPWASRNLLDSLTAGVCAESDGTETGIIMVITTMYNRVRANGGSFKNILSGAYSVWSDGGANKKFNSHPSNWDTVKNYVNGVFTNGACSTFVGKEFVTPNWDLDRNGNNNLYHLKPNTKYTLSSEQVSTMWYYGFEAEWNHTYVNKKTGKKPDNQIRHSENKLLAVLGTNTPQAVCLDPNMSKKLKIDKPVEIINNGDKHISDLANGFLDAINRTSQSSEVNVDIGMSNLSSGDTLYLQSTRNKNEFGKVFDIIINGYGNSVSEVKWVIPNNGNQSSPPVYLITTVTRNSNSTKIIVVSEGDVNNPVTDLSFDKNGGMNQDFCKALYKKYKNNKDQLSKDLIPSTQNIDNLFNMYEQDIKDCNTYVNGESSSSDSQVTTTDWNTDAFAQNLHYWQANICESAGVKRSNYGGCGKCTGVINRALKSTGCGDKYWAKYPWEVYAKMNSSNSDFKEIDNGECSSKQHFLFRNSPQKGDICLMWCKNNHNTSSSSNHFHSCAFDGSKWYSDFAQNNCNVYTRGFECTMEWHLFRHK